jgi:ABC-type multidrug transport system fused ATPase/permease subunit
MFSKKGTTSFRVHPNGGAIPFSPRWLGLLRFWSFIKPHRGLVGLLCLCLIFNQATMVVIPIAIGRVLDGIIPSGNHTQLNLMAGVLAAVLAVKMLLIFWERQLTALVGTLIVRDVRVKLHGHFLRMSLRFLDDYQVGRIVARIMGDTECVKNLLLTGIINGSASAVRFVFVLATLLYLDWRMTLVSCAILPFFFYGFWKCANRLKPAYDELNENGMQLFSSLNETFSSVRVVKTYCGERRANLNFLSRVNAMVRKSLYVSRTQHILTVVWEGIAWLSLIAMIWYGGGRVMAGSLSVGGLVAFYGLLGQMQGPIADFVGLNATLQPALTSLKQLFEVFDTAPEIADRPGAHDAGALRGEIEFKDVEFTYKTGQQASQPTSAAITIQPRLHTLQNISFRVAAGQCVAIVGPSGAGKSTLLNLLARLYDIDNGAIIVDGVDIRDYRLRSYLKNFGIVLQDNFLFRGTIRDNIRFAMPDATDAEIINAAKLAGAWQFIEKLEKGLDAHCEERGSSLSGGQKQRLAMARAIVANPRILVLDEAMSALDSHTEAQIQGALKELMKNRTTFIVAHRLSTIVNATLIIVVDEGRIVEMGSHSELLRLGGHYAQMLHEYFGKNQAEMQASVPVG